MQVLCRGARVTSTVTAETTHLIVARLPGKAGGAAAVIGYKVCLPAAVLEAVKLHAGGAAGLAALRLLLQQRKVVVTDVR